jgi:peptide/nickel transport system substrate-binding protein
VRRSKPSFAIATLASAFALLALPACSRRAEPADATTLTFLIESMPANLDPRVGTDAQSQHLDSLLFSSLVRADPQFRLAPDLAKSWEQTDPLTCIFHLRSGVRFQDGRPLTSADVKYTFDSILSGKILTPKRGSFRLLASVEAPDDATVVFHLREPYASFLWNLVRPAVGIVPNASGTEISSHPVGTGPFRFVSSRQDEEVVLERNPDYFAGAPAIERVRFRIVPDATTRALELLHGTADVAINSLTPDMALALAQSPQLEMLTHPGATLAYIAINFEGPTLTRLSVRQALASATDRASVIRYLLRGQARLASSLLPPSHWAFDQNLPQIPYDPAHAAALLESSGFHPAPDGTRLHLTLKISTEESTRLLAEVLQEQWRRAGIAIEIRPLELATLLSDVSHGSFQLTTLRWIGANDDPDIFDFVFNSGRIPPAGANRGHYHNPALDALLNRARIEQDPQARLALLQRIQATVAADLPYLLLWYPDNVCLHNRRVLNISLGPTGDYDFLATATLK